MPTPKFKKRSGDIFIGGVSFSPWPLNTGESLVNSNTRGSLGATVTDEDGTDVTGTILVESPSIDATGTQVLLVMGYGADGASYNIEVIAPTSDEELLTERVVLQVKD